MGLNFKTLWNYASDVTFEQVGDDILIEHAFKYAGFNGIATLLGLYDRAKLLQVWERELKNNLRFKS